ncbi:MAG: hypothetical protein ACO3C4_06330, partial [Candidatus Limnocylindrus sp.]
YLETPGMEEGWDKLNVERTIQLAQGNLKLKPLPAEAPGVPKPTKKVPTKGVATKPALKRPVTKKKTAVKGRAPAKRAAKRR